MTSHTPPRPRISTESLAALAHVKASTIRLRLCRTGSYFGIQPDKLPNGRLSWPADSYERLLSYGRTPSPSITRPTEDTGCNYGTQG